MDQEDKYRHGVDCFMVVDQKELNNKKKREAGAGSKVVERNNKWIYETQEKRRKVEKMENKTRRRTLHTFKLETHNNKNHTQSGNYIYEQYKLFFQVLIPFHY